MTISTLLNRPVTITRRSASGEIDIYGDAVSTETTVVTVGELQQRVTAEPVGQGEFSDTTWLLVLPAGTEIDTGDTATVGGETFEMVGAPWPARNPRTGVESHVECAVRRTAGAGDLDEAPGS